MQIIRGYDYQVDVAIWAHKHSYDRMWPVYNYTVFNKKPMPYVNSKASFYKFFIEKLVLDFNSLTFYNLQNCGPVYSCHHMKKPIFEQKVPKCIVQCLVSYFRDPEKFSMCFSKVFRLEQARNFGEKKHGKFHGTWKLDATHSAYG